MSYYGNTQKYSLTKIMQGQLHGHIVRATKVQCSALQSEMSRIFTLKCTVLFFRRSALKIGSAVLYYSPALSAYYVHTETQA